ncbi:MAG: hypothetical protein FJX46_10780 [Alphaproteobacteria bacterium]|nr:hypothetical protein [Alphaproteobacteria bacterium]
MSQAPAEDRAWVRIPTPLAPEALIEFCRDVERLLRINSMLEFERLGPAGEGRYELAALNLSTGQRIETAFRIEPQDRGLRLIYESGLKTATEIAIEPGERGGARSFLVVTDDYAGTPEAERQARAAEVDRSLPWWGRDLHRYLGHWARWSGWAPWRWYMRRVWQPMKPKARRITFMLWVIAAFELAALVVVAAAYALD